MNREARREPLDRIYTLRLRNQVDGDEIAPYLVCKMNRWTKAWRVAPARRVVISHAETLSDRFGREAGNPGSGLVLRSSNDPYALVVLMGESPSY